MVSSNKTIVAWNYTLDGATSAFTPNITINVSAGPHLLTVLALDSESLTASASVAFTYTPPPPPVVYDTQRSYCLNDQVFYQRMAIPADNGTLVMNDRLTYCDYGCQNFTLTSLGSPGCAESPLTFNIILIVAAIVITLLVVWLGRRSA